MHLLRLARNPPSLRAILRRASTAPHPHPTVEPSQSIIPLSNVEAHWEKLSHEERLSVHRRLEELQKKNWKELTLDEKKAAYYVAFGPHGPRTPANPPGTVLKVFLYTMGLIGVSGILFTAIHSQAAPPPRTLTKEWQEASNQRAIEQRANPITGITSEGYKGEGFVTESK